MSQSFENFHKQTPTIIGQVTGNVRGIINFSISNAKIKNTKTCTISDRTRVIHMKPVPPGSYTEEPMAILVNKVVI